MKEMASGCRTAGYYIPSFIPELRKLSISNKWHLPFMSLLALILIATKDYLVQILFRLDA